MCLVLVPDRVRFLDNETSAFEKGFLNVRSYSTHILSTSPQHKLDNTLTIHSSRGGIMIQMHGWISCLHKCPFDIGCIQVLIVQVQYHNHAINLVVIYVNPPTCMEAILNTIRHLTETLDLYKFTLIMSDFNVNILNNLNSSFLDYMKGLGFLLLVKVPTTDYDSQFDHVNRCIRMDIPTQIDIVDPYYSDHDCICITFYMFYNKIYECLIL